MGAVQKLATVVIVGLVGLATLLVVYLAYEPTRRDDEVVEQEEAAIERGIETYIANCLTCHGPAGEGFQEPGRIGWPLASNVPIDPAETGDGLTATERNQTDDPTGRAERRQVIYDALHYGRNLMPAWGEERNGQLNDEQIEELILMIQNVDWDRVYNEAAETYGGYPTAPVPEAAAGPQPTAAPDGGGGQAPAATIEGYDIGWRYEGQDTASGGVTVTVAPGATISLPNVGAALHNFAVDALGIDVDMPVGETVEAVIPADAAPGTYEFYCNVPGHKAAGMVGTLTIDPAAGPPAGGAPPAAEALPAGAPSAEDGQGGEPAAAPVTVEGYDIGWRYEGQDTAGGGVTVTVAPGATISLPNVGAALHNFAVDELGVDVDMPVGETVEATIPVDAAPGTYEFYCNVPGHKAAGMVGTLTVQ